MPVTRGKSIIMDGAPSESAGQDVMSDTVLRREHFAFSGIVGSVQSLVLILYVINKFEYSGHHDAGRYGYFRDVNIMIFFGFGFLMTFLRRYGISAIAYTLIVSALVVEVSFIWEYMLMAEHYYGGEWPEKWPLNLENLMNGLFCAGAVMISFGAVLGKVTPSQLVLMAIIESLLFWINVRLSIVELEAHDVGGGMTIHSFGAYFGLAVTAFFSGKDAHGHFDNRSNYTSDITSLAGTIMLWLLWPSFNAAVAGTEAEQFRAIANTFISLCSSTLSFALLTRILNGFKFDVVHLQNATLAGGVAMGVAADLVTRPYWAAIGGLVAGLVSCFGYTVLTPLLSKCGVQDICGVHNLHGMPGLISAVVGMIACKDAGKQAGALGVTMAVAIVGGILSGLAMRALGKLTGTDLMRGNLYNDKVFWSVANDYHVVVGEDTATPPKPTMVVSHGVSPSVAV